MTEQDRRLEAARELRRRGRLNPEQEAALDELERRQSASQQPSPGQPRGIAGRAAQALYGATEAPARGLAQMARQDGVSGVVGALGSDILSPVRAIARPPGQEMEPRTIAPAGPARQAFQGQMMGFGDELLGSVIGAGRRALFDEDSAAAQDAATREMRGSVEMARAMRPASSLITEGAGAAAPFVAAAPLTGAGGLLGNIARTATPIGAKPSIGTAARTIGTGILAGGVAGMGEGEGDAIERLPSAGIGALFGAGTGALGPVAGSIASRIGEPIARAGSQAMSGVRSVMTPGQRRGAQRLEQEMGQEGMTFSGADARMRELRSQGFDDVTIADAASPRGAVQSAIRQGGTTGGPARVQLEGLLDRRVESQLDRVTNVIERTFGGSPNVTRQVADMTRERAARAAPMYEAAFGEPGNLVTVPREGVQDILSRTAPRDLALARRLARREGRTLTLQGDGPVSVQDLHYVKLALDDQIGSLGPVERRAVAGVKRDLMQAMPQEYRDAASLFAGESALINAMETGRRALRGDAEAVEAAAQAMLPAERELYQIGLARGILERVQGTRDSGDIVTRIIGNEDSRRRIRAAFDSDEAYQDFVSGLRVEQDRIRNARFMASSTGSQTASRQADADIDALDVAFNLARGRIGSLQGRLTSTAAKFGGQEMRRRQVIERLQGNQELVEIATRVMGENDPIMQEILMREASDRFGQQSANAIRDAIRAANVPAAQQQPRSGE
jgi:hypothetical protein